MSIIPNDNGGSRAAILRKVAEVLALARSLYPDYLSPDPVVSFDLRGRSRGGLAHADRKVTFNLDWYAADPAYYLGRTIAHEIAHIVAYATKRGRGHNAGWRRIDRSLGGDGTRCNNNPAIRTVAKARRTVEYLYRGERGTQIWVGPVHHNRLQKAGQYIRSYGPGASTYKLRSPTGEAILHSGFLNDCRMKK